MILGRADDAGRSFAWLYRGGRFTPLPGLSPTDATSPVALNGRGDAVGYSEETTGPPGGERRMVLWPANRLGTVLEMAVSGPTSVVDIDDDGTIIGLASGMVTTSYRWRRGGLARVLHGPSGTTDVGVIAIRDGWISGWENDVFPVNAFARNARAANQIAGSVCPTAATGAAT
jgi:hypothetical protein